MRPLKGNFPLSGIRAQTFHEETENGVGQGQSDSQTAKRFSGQMQNRLRTSADVQRPGGQTGLQTTGATRESRTLFSEALFEPFRSQTKPEAPHLSRGSGRQFCEWFLKCHLSYF